MDMIVTPVRTAVFGEGDNLGSFIRHHLPLIPERSILVVTSKIVALSEKRTAEYLGEKNKASLIRSESEWALKTKWTWLTIKDGTVMASAGIDESNGNGKLILLPRDSFRAAALLRRSLLRIYGLQELGIIITDSRLLPLRAGVVGVALGYAGFKGVRDYRGSRDIFGRVMSISRTDVADSLATTAVLLMGEGREQQPLALIEEAPVKFQEKVRRKELHIDVSDDVYGPLFRAIKTRNKKSRGPSLRS